MWNGWSHTKMGLIKIGRNTSGARDPNPTLDQSAQGSLARKISPHNFQLKKKIVEDGAAEK